jgi:polar amino acid transport system substrate-binding protein
LNTIFCRYIYCVFLLSITPSLLLASDASQELDTPSLVRVALPSSIPPYALKADQSGIIPELLNHIFHKMNYSPQYTFLPNKRVVKAFSNNQYDAAFSVPRPEDTSRIYYSHKIFDFNNIAVTLKSDKLKLIDISDLANKRIAAFQNATQFLGFKYNEAIKESVFYNEFNDQQEQLMLLIKKRADVIVLEKRIFNYYFKQLNTHNLLDGKFEIHAIFPSSPRYMAFHSTKARSLFNAAFADIKQSYIYQELLKNEEF